MWCESGCEVPLKLQGRGRGGGLLEEAIFAQRPAGGTEQVLGEQEGEEQVQASEGFTGSSDVSEEQQRRQHSWSPVSECMVRRRPEDGREPGEATEVKWGDLVHLCRQGT